MPASAIGWIAPFRPLYGNDDLDRVGHELEQPAFENGTHHDRPLFRTGRWRLQVKRYTSRTATRVKDGRVQPKNRNRPTGHEGYVIDRQSPGCGCRHVVTKKDLQAFIDLIPEWPRYSVRLERIVLASHDDSADGAHAFYHEEETGTIYLMAWPEDLWVELSPAYFQSHRSILETWGVSTSPTEDGTTCHFTEAQARAFSLLHVFMHELGHHFDRIHQKHRSSSKGEDYAEQFANSRFDHLFVRYVEAFGHPRR